MRVYQFRHLGIPAIYLEPFPSRTKEELKLSSLICIPHGWCPGEDSNLHTLRHMDLNHARLPIPPPGHALRVCYRFRVTESNLFSAALAKDASITYFFIFGKQHLIKRSTTPPDPSVDGLGGPELPPDFDPDVPSRERIMAHLRAAEGPVPQEELAQAMNVEFPLSVGFMRRLKAMERDGQLFFNPQGMLLLNTKLDFISGRVQGHRDGFGFLLRDDGGPDLFLAPREMLKVLHGDRVLVRPEGDYRGKPEGTIVEVIERRTDRLVGRYLKERGMHIVVPEDQRIKHDILIPKGGRGQAQHGQVVTVEIVQQPTRHTQPLGRIIEVLGDIDDAGMEIEIAVRKFDVPHEFSKKALAQADRIPDAVQPAELEGRVDLRDVPFITIDGEDARDFDDAVYCEPIELGTAKRSAMGWRLLVAIADVSHNVKPGD